MKDTVRVAASQLRTLHELLKNRVDPETCEYSTAAKVKSNPTAKKVEVNRPLQMTTVRHKLVYCECLDWDSKSDKDIDHCMLSDEERGIEEFIGISGFDLSATPSVTPADVSSTQLTP